MKRTVVPTDPLDSWTPEARVPEAVQATRAQDAKDEALRQAKAVIGALMTPHARFPSGRRLTRAWAALQAV